MKYNIRIVTTLLVAATFVGMHLISPSAEVYAQQKVQSDVTTHTVSGKVIDENNETLPGAMITVVGTMQKTVTDIDGNFKLQLTTDEARITVEYLGMEKTTVKVRAGKTATVVMQFSSHNIDEVVVNGYFAKTKSQFTGAAKTYDAEQLMTANPVNLLSALSIVDPSFKMTENIEMGSDPNSVPEFTIRGSSSLPDDKSLRSQFQSSPNMPTFIMDGFEVSAEKVFDTDVTRIESVTILKDAAATAVYGSRASNGVIVITTKQPASGRLRLTYNMDMSINGPDLSDYNLLDASRKLELERAAGYFDALGSAAQTEARMEDYNYRRSLVERGYDTYWLSKPLRTAVGHKHAVNIEGGGEAMRYSLDLTYENAPGVMKGSARERMGMGVTLLYRWKNLTFRNNMTYDNVSSDNSPYGTFGTYARMNPYYAYEDKYGNYIKELEKANYTTNRLDVYNPLYNTTLNTVDASSYSQFVNNFGVNWYINDSFRFKGDFAVSQRKNESTIFLPANHTSFATYGDNDFYRKGSYTTSSGKELNYNANMTMSYFRQVGKHWLNANVAWNVQQEKGDMYTVKAEGFQDENLDHISFALQYAQNSSPSGDDYISRLMGFLANAGYTYDNRYMIDASARVDGSSKFGYERRWAPFWSTGAGWNMHKEKFAKDWKWLDEMRFKVSYGMTGSQAFSPYQALIMYEYLNGQRYNDLIGAQMLGLGNPYLQWQQTYQLNVGTDIRLLNNRIVLSANYYRKTSKGLLTDVTLPPSSGFTTYRENLGEVENNGFELDGRFTVYKSKDTYVNISLSGVHNVNRLNKISNSLQMWNKAQDTSTENVQRPKVKFIEGESVNTIWAVRSHGINPADGKEIFVKADGTLTDVYDVNDQVPVGCTDPDLEGNLGLDVGWKGLRVNLYMRYRLGGDMYNYTLVERVENADKRYNTDERVLENRWQKPGDISFFKDVKDETMTRPTSRFVERYNFLQLASLNISYDLPKKLVMKWRMESMRVSFSTTDLFRVSSVAQERGIDYPFARAARISLRVVF